MKVLENECATLEIFNYVAQKDWGIKETKKEIEKRKMLYFMGMMKLTFPQTLYYYENEVYKKSLKIESKEMAEVEMNNQSIIDSESCIYKRYCFFHEYHKYFNNPNPGFLYLFYNPKTKLTKIGVSKNKSKRKSDIERASGIELKELNSMFLRNPYIMESFLHLVFYMKRGLGEWFNLNDKDIEQIEYIFKYC